MVAPDTAVPFTYHWNNGAAPSFTRVVLNVTDVPGQTGLADAVMTILTGKRGLTVMEIGAEFAGLSVAQGDDEVNLQKTVKLEAEEWEKVELVAPVTGESFTNH